MGEEVTLNNNEEAVLRGVATCCLVLPKNLMILRNLGANFPTDLAFYPLFYSKPKHGTGNARASSFTSFGDEHLLPLRSSDFAPPTHAQRLT